MMLLQGRSRNGLYLFSSSFVVNNEVSAFVGVRASIAIWHSWLGHPEFSVIRSLISNNKLQLHGTVTYDFCSSCPLGKSHKLPFHLSSSTSSFPLELIRSDVWISHSYSINGYKYYVVFVDNFSKYVWLYPLKLKYEVFHTFVHHAL